MSEKPKTRRVERAVDIAADPADIWKALTTGPGLSNWFVMDARCGEGEGATQWVSWGPDEECEVAIGVWEPEKRLQVFVAGDDGKPLPEWPSVTEYTIERSDGGVCVRLVESGIPVSEDWDGMYDGLSVGWTMYLATLKHVLEHHPDERRRAVSFTRTTSDSPGQVWERVVGPTLFALPDLDTVGDIASAEVPGEGRTEAIAGVVDPPRVLTLRLSDLNDSFLALALHRQGDGTYINFVLSLFGLASERAQRIEEECIERLSSAFPPPSD